MKLSRSFLRLPVLAMIFTLLLFGCKSKKAVMTVSNVPDEKAKLEQEAALKKLQALEDEAKRKEAEEKARRDAEAAKAAASLNSSRATEANKLNQYFESIASSGSSTSANSSITEALSMFSSPQAPVLIVISESNGQKDYDRPTTILNYLNYLKDQKKSNSTVMNMKTDASGKITELELKKNF
jgi:hypothetical protein